MPNGTIPFPSESVPILGQPVRLIAWFPTAMVVCQCQPGNDPLFIIGVASTECPKCQKQYSIDLIHHERGHLEKQQFGLGVAIPAGGGTTS
jgi:hypothetical protein